MSQRKKRFNIMLEKDTHEKLTALAKSSKIKMKMIVGLLVDLCVKYQFLKPGWKSRLNEALNKVDQDRLFDLDENCPAFQIVDEFYICIWAQKNSPPKVRKLSKDQNEALKACLGCTRTREILDGIANYEETIRNLKARAKQGIVVSIPRCDYPSELSEDGLSFWCRRQAKRMTVDQCKKLRKGTSCMNLKWLNVPVKGELPDPER